MFGRGGLGRRVLIRGVFGSINDFRLGTFLSGVFASPGTNDVEDLAVKKDHEKARNVERAHGGVDDEVGVVKGAQVLCLRSLVCVVGSKDDG